VQTPRVLVIATQLWPIAARISLALAKVGFRVAVVSPFGNIVRTITAIEIHYSYRGLQGPNSIKLAITAWSPDLLVCSDDRAVRELHLLHRQASDVLDEENEKALVDLIELSLGDPNSFATADANSNFIDYAKNIGVRCPESNIARDYLTLVKEVESATYPIAIKADGSFGGRAVRIVNNPDQAWEGLRELVLPFLWPDPIKQLIGKLMPRSLFARLFQRRTVRLQDLIVGRDVNRAVVCWKGEVLAGFSVAAIETSYPHGPATVIRIIDNPEMEAAAASLVRSLKLSGLIGFDFILDAASQAWLLEMNPRVTPICHLSLEDGTNLAGALFSRMTGSKPNDNPPIVKGNAIALFPQELRRSECSEYLDSSKQVVYHDVPWSEPKFVYACLNEQFGGRYLKRAFRKYRRAAFLSRRTRQASVSAVAELQTDSIPRLDAEPSTVAVGPRLRSRVIMDADLDTLAKLLGRGLGYSSQHFLQILERLRQHPTPAGFPKYGYVLQDDDRIVGAILLIFSTIWSEGNPSIRCHVTSWYVEPYFRSYATLFFSKALKNNDVTYINVSARPATVPIIKAQGFEKYSNGEFVAIPALQFRSDDDHVEVIEGERVPNAPFESFEKDLLLAHANFGCISLWCVTSDRAYPFVFHERKFKGLIPGVQLVFCRDIQDFVRFARPLGLFLASRGKVLVRFDSNGPVRGLVGKYFDGMEPRYYKGPKPRLGDLAYTQTVMVPYVRRKFGSWFVSRERNRSMVIPSYAAQRIAPGHR
jgi:hypothetical protein